MESREYSPQKARETVTLYSSSKKELLFKNCRKNLTYTAVSHHPQNLAIAVIFSAHSTANTERTMNDVNTRRNIMSMADSETGF